MRRNIFLGEFLLPPLIYGEGWGGVSMLMCFLNIFPISLFWWHVKHFRKGNGWHQLLEDSQMSLCINSATKASNNEGAHIWEWTDDAPGIEPF
jgi:hypothetical protein